MIKLFSSPLMSLSLVAIKCYQKYISPHKGFSCSFRLVTGECSCSAYGYKVISRYGLFTGWGLLKRRFMDCSWAGNKLRSQGLSNKIASPNYFYQKHKQQGYIDCDCPTLDCMPDLPKCSIDDVCDMFDCCDWPNSKKKKNNNDREALNEKKYKYLNNNSSVNPPND